MPAISEGTRDRAIEKVLIRLLSLGIFTTLADAGHETYAFVCACGHDKIAPFAIMTARTDTGGTGALPPGQRLRPKPTVTLGIRAQCPQEVHLAEGWPVRVAEVELGMC